MRDSSRINFTMWNRFTYLYDEFDPTGTNNGNPLPANSDYYYTNLIFLLIQMIQKILPSNKSIIWKIL